jgi:alkylation response protein AidB-like acyl-CoA dehydrogenase
VDQPGYVDLHWVLISTILSSLSTPIYSTEAAQFYPQARLINREQYFVQNFILQGMFVPAIKGQGTEEQQKKWLPLAYRFQIIGCYAQTELGHGSNVQGLETTATFDPKTDEFVIHSPTLTSSKWWPGGLGKASTHAVVYARLITEGKDYGIHGFIVQLRSLEDHSPLPGVTLGDIGGKFGSGAYNSMDNGVLRFDHVRIPRDQMLMRFVHWVIMFCSGTCQIHSDTLM